MTRDKILQTIYEDDIYKGYAASFCPNLVDEMISELVFRFLNMDEQKLLDLYSNKELKVYALAILRNMVYYKYDPFRKKFLEDSTLPIMTEIIRIEDEQEEDNSDLTTELRKDIDKYLTNRADKIKGEWYNQKLFDLYFQDGHTFKEISEMTGISCSSIYLSVKGVQEIVQTKFKSTYYDLRK
jgi:DNA-directed RNA polymerase specialized sigma subunit